MVVQSQDLPNNPEFLRLREAVASVRITSRCSQRLRERYGSVARGAARGS